MLLAFNCDRDDVDILYSLQHHGWSTCILFVGDLTHVCHISHVFGDPIRDPIEATFLLLKGAIEVEFIWWGEPGGNRWKIVRNKDRYHQITIVVTEFLSGYGELIKEETIVVKFEIKISHFSTLIYYQMKKIATLLKDKSFEQNRSGCFPHADFCKLESLFLD
jgi:hypothetical protein